MIRRDSGDIDVVGMRRNGDRSEGKMGKIGRFGIFWERQMDGLRDSRLRS